MFRKVMATLLALVLVLAASDLRAGGKLHHRFCRIHLGKSLLRYHEGCCCGEGR